MAHYLQHSLNPLGTEANFTTLAAPQGTSMPQQVAEMLRDFVGLMGLPDAGVLTPWAGRSGDLVWQEVVKPDTNIATFEITDSQVAAATEALFGQPLPFIAVLTGELQTEAVLRRIVADSPYEFYQTQGVYRQEDTDDVPRILFLHWLRVKDLPDIPQGAKSLDAVAKEMYGQLRFAQQIPVEGSTYRSPPAISFQEALDLQEPRELVLPPDPGSSSPEAPQTIDPEGPYPSAEEIFPTPKRDKSKAASLAGPVILGLGVVAATIALGKAIRK